MRLNYLFIFLSLIMPSIATAQIKSSVTYQYYPVKPKAGIPLSKQVLIDSPLSPNGVKVTAMAPWNIKYDVDYNKLGNNMCSIRYYEISYTCNIILPRLESSQKELNSAFNRYIPSLRQHEEQHCKIVSDHARLLQDKILNLQKESCGNLRKSVILARNSVISAANKAHEVFDKQTSEKYKAFYPLKHFLGHVIPRYSE